MSDGIKQGVRNFHNMNKNIFFFLYEKGTLALFLTVCIYLPFGLFRQKQKETMNHI